MSRGFFLSPFYGERVVSAGWREPGEGHCTAPHPTSSLTLGCRPLPALRGEGKRVRRAPVHFRQVPVQQAPCEAAIVPLDRLPRPPEREATSLARGRRTNRKRFPAADPPRSGACSPAPAPHVAPSSRRLATTPSAEPGKRRMKADFGGNMTIFLVQPRFYSLYLYGSIAIRWRASRASNGPRSWTA